MSVNKQYDKEDKIQAVKLAREVGCKKAAEELGMPYNTLSGWMHKAKRGELDIGKGNRSPEESLNIAEELQVLRKKVKEQEKEIKRLNELNEFLEEASAFFAASRRKSGKTKD